MSELSKQALKVENNESFPNNNTNYITPAILRAYNVDIIDSTVNQTQYNTDSGSWNVSISALNTFTSSQQLSFNALNAFTASQLTINSGVNSFTQSANGSITALNAYTASATSSISVYDEGVLVSSNTNALNFTGNGITSSYSSGKVVVSVDFTNLNSATASLQSQLATIGTQSGSWITESETGSFATSAITASSLITASFNNSTRNLTFTKGDASTFNVNIPDVSGSAGDFVTTSSFNAYTASANQRLTAIESVSGSWITESETGSFAILGANQIFTGNNTITGNTVVSQSAHFGTASFYAPMVISNGIASNVNITGSLVATKVGAYDFDNLYYGSQLGGTIANGTFFGYGSNSYEFVVGAYSGPNDNELKITTDANGIQFGDFNGSGYNTFLKLLPNAGSNPSPILTRGVQITGSLEHSGSLRHTGNSYISGTVYVSGSVNLLNEGGNGHAFSGKALFLTNSVQTGITVESPIHFYQVGKGDFYIQNNVSGVGSGSMNLIAANNANLNISASNLLSNAAKTTINTGDFQVGTDPTDNIYNGFKVDRTTNNYSMYNLGNTQATFDFGAVDGTGFTYSTELLLTAVPSKLTFQDFSVGDYAYHDWLTIPQNTGSNPAPQFNRGLASTGSITIKSGSGDLYVHGHKQFNCGAWQDTTTQSGSADTAYAFKFNTTDVLDGVILSGSTGLQATAAGIYNIQWSGQLVQGASSADVTIWLRKNGTNVTASGGTVTMASNTKLLPAWNYMLELAANDVVEIMWASTHASTTWAYLPAETIYPSCASIIATISQVR